MATTLNSPITTTAMSHPFVTSLRAFHADPAIKATYLTRVRAHAAADEIVQGQYWERGQGCAVGCTIHGSDHSAYERELGIPQILARLEDRLFEMMAFEDAKGWPERFLASIAAGADLSLVWPRWAHWMLVDETDGVVRFATTKQTRQSIAGVAALYGRVIAGESVSRGEFSAADAAAYAAAYAAYAAAAADAAAAAAAYGRTARQQFGNRASEKLLALLSAANVAESAPAAASPGSAEP